MVIIMLKVLKVYNLLLQLVCARQAIVCATSLQLSLY